MGYTLDTFRGSGAVFELGIQMESPVSSFFLRRKKWRSRKEVAVYFSAVDLPHVLSSLEAAASALALSGYRQPVGVIECSAQADISVSVEPYQWGQTTAVILRQRRGLAIESDDVEALSNWLDTAISSLLAKLVQIVDPNAQFHSSDDR